MVFFINIRYFLHKRRAPIFTLFQEDQAFVAKIQKWSPTFSHQHPDVANISVTFWILWDHLGQTWQIKKLASKSSFRKREGSILSDIGKLIESMFNSTERNYRRGNSKNYCYQVQAPYWNINCFAQTHTSLTRILIKNSFKIVHSSLQRNAITSYMVCHIPYVTWVSNFIVWP